MDDLTGRNIASIALRKRMNSWWRWRCMQRWIDVFVTAALADLHQELEP